MAEPTTTTASPPETPLVYRPISFLAILGFICAAVFLLLAVFCVIVASIYGTPPLLSRWFLALPLTGGVLCLLALRRIQLSEGALTGSKLSYWGMWLSLVGGLGYGAYDLGTGWAIQQQSNRFVTTIDEQLPNETGFFAHVQNGDLNAAFLLTQPYSARAGINPADMKQMTFRFDQPEMKQPKGKLTQFKENNIVYVLKIAGENKPVPLGVRSWKFDKGSYIVERFYQLQTNEIDAQMLVVTRSSEGEGGRRWHVQWPIELLPTSKPTKLGSNLFVLRRKSSEVLADWCQRLNQGIATKEKPTDETDWQNLPLKLQDFRETLKNKVSDFVAGKPLRTMRAGMESSQFAPWKTVNGKLQFTIPLMIMMSGASGAPESVLVGHAVVESTKNIDPAESSGPTEWVVRSYRFKSHQAVAPGQMESSPQPGL